MNKYKQLQEYDRVKIYDGLKNGLRVIEIVEKMGRHVSTIYRELDRNSDRIGYLYPRDAHQNSLKRKAKHGSKIDRNEELKAYILAQINLGRSPNVIARTWNEKRAGITISAEAIYQYTYHLKMLIYSF